MSSGVTRRTFLKNAAGGAMALGSSAALIAQPSGSAHAQEKIAQTRVVSGSADGRNGKITVKVALTQNHIDSITVIKQDETPLIAAAALTRIPQLVVLNQSIDVDLVSGATMTSLGVRGAIENALDAAGITASDLENSGSQTGITVQAPIDDPDVIVVGAGLAGLSCAVRLIQNKKRVAIFEETAHVGGSSCVSAGWIVGPGTAIEAEAGVKDSSEQFYNYMVQITESKGAKLEYPEVARQFCNKAGETFDWLDQYVGVDFGARIGSKGLYDLPDVPRIYGMNNGGGAADSLLLEYIEAGVEEGTASLSLEARVTSIATDDSGAVSGVTVMYKDGTELTIPTKAVVLCTGGYSANMELLQAHGYENCGICAPSTASGHGFPLAEALGAQIVHDQEAATYGGGIPDFAYQMRYQVNFALPGQIWVDVAGKRVANEDESLNAQRVWDEAPQNIAYVLFSEAQRVEHIRPVVVTSYLEGEITPQASWAYLDKLIEAGNVAFKASSAEELAEKAGIDPTAFAETISAYNAYAEAGEDPDFGRNAEGMQQLKGDLYAILCVPYQLMPAAGLKITPNAEVVDNTDTPISGLFTAGDQIGLYQYAGRVRAGCGLGGAATWGYVAADSATAYIG